MIAGHSGYIGKALVKELKKLDNYEIVGISRNAASGQDDDYAVRKANLFSMLETENALEGGDIGVFLVHSMSPNDRLAQGRFLILIISSQITLLGRLLFLISKR